MASTALGGVYILSESGIDQLIELDRSPSSAPLSAPGFVSRRPSSREDIDQTLASLQRRVSRRSSRKA